MDRTSVFREINQEMTAPKQVALVQKQIDLRLEELGVLESFIEEQQKQFKTNAASMKLLGLKYSHAKRLLEAQKRDFSAHERDLIDLTELRRCIEEEISSQGAEGVDLLPPVSDQRNLKRAEISIIATKVMEIEEEAHATRFVQRLSQEHLNIMNHYREGILGIVAGLKNAFSPIHRVPAECWAVIFHYRVEGDFEEYIERTGAVSILSTTLILSHVCSFWRQVVHAERELWKYFICEPNHAKTENQVERWRHYTSFEPKSFVFLTNLNARSRSPVPNDQVKMAQIVMSSRSHSIHVITGIHGVALSAAGELPFNGQLSASMQINETATRQFIDGICACFPVATTLGLKFKIHLPLLNPSIYKRDPPIERLFLDLADFDPFRPDYYFHEEWLKELHVIQNGESALIGVTRKFPRLEVIGITPTDTMWLRAYKLPALQKLVLYGPKSATVTAPTLLELSQHSNFDRFRELELRNCLLYKPTAGPSWSIAPLILAIAENLRLVETILCIDSFIEGESLVALVRSLMNTNANQTPSKLKKITVDCCSGINRRDCELIAAEVEKLVVHV